MKRKILNLILAVMLVTTLFALTACGESEETTDNTENNIMYDEASQDASDTTKSEAEDLLSMALTSVQSEFIATVWINNSSAQIKDYCTQEVLSENLSSDDATIESLVWDEDIATGTMNYLGYTFSFTLTPGTSGTVLYVEFGE